MGTAKRNYIELMGMEPERARLALSIEGEWRVRYSRAQVDPFVNDEGEPDEFGNVTLRGGVLEGSDPWGFEYIGFYSVENGGRLSASVVTRPYLPEATSILDDSHRQFHMEFEGEYNSPDHVSLVGFEVGKPEERVVLNCQRLSEA